MPEIFRMVSESGRTAPSSQGRGVMPPKEPGKHRWIAYQAHVLDASGAAAADEGARVTLGIETLVFLGIGCADCHEPYQECRTAPCAAGDEWGDDR